MQADRIRALLAERPYLGPQTMAQILKTTPQVIRVVASRERIKLMDRYEVEAWIEANLAGAGVGKA